MLDPFSAGVEFILGKMKQSMMMLYFKAIFAMCAVWVIAFSIAGGLVLKETQNWAVGIGSGMVVAGFSALGTFLATDLARKVKLVFPAAIAKAPELRGMEVVTQMKDKKEKGEKHEESNAVSTSTDAPTRSPADIIAGR